MPSPMTRERYVTVLDLIGWSAGTVARKLDLPDDRQPRRWKSDGGIPDPVANWLERLAELHQQNPPPPRPDVIDAGNAR